VTIRQYLATIVIGAAMISFLQRHVALGQTRLSELQRGARIRVVAPAAGVPWPARALFDSAGTDSVYLRELSDPPALRAASRVAVARASIRRLEVPIIGGRSRWDHARAGTLWGLGIYAVAAAAYVVRERSTCSGPDCFGEGFAWVGLVNGIPVAAGTGATVGFLLPVKEWRRLSLSGPLRATAMTDPDRHQSALAELRRAGAEGYRCANRGVPRWSCRDMKWHRS